MFESGLRSSVSVLLSTFAVSCRISSAIARGMARPVRSARRSIFVSVNNYLRTKKELIETMKYLHLSGPFHSLLGGPDCAWSHFERSTAKLTLGYTRPVGSLGGAARSGGGANLAALR